MRVRRIWSAGACSRFGLRSTTFQRWLSLTCLATLLGSVVALPFTAIAEWSWATTEVTATAVKSPDMKDVGTLATKLMQVSDKLSLYLNTKLSEEALKALASYQGDEANLEQPLRELTAIFKNESLYTPQRFAGVTLRPETKRLLAQNPQGEDLVRLNRLLLEDAYSLKDQTVAEFKFQNRGTNPITVNELKFSCSCTDFSFRSTPVAPMSNGVLRVFLPQSVFDETRELVAFGTQDSTPTALTIRVPKLSNETNLAARGSKSLLKK